jgi:hypothetical protein
LSVVAPQRLWSCPGREQVSCRGASFVLPGLDVGGSPKVLVAKRRCNAGGILFLLLLLLLLAFRLGRSRLLFSRWLKVDRSLLLFGRRGVVQDIYQGPRCRLTDPVVRRELFKRRRT